MILKVYLVKLRANSAQFFSFLAQQKHLPHPSDVGGAA